MIRKKRISFEVYVDSFYSKNNLKILDKSIEQYKQGNVIIKIMEELESMEHE